MVQAELKIPMAVHADDELFVGNCLGGGRDRLVGKAHIGVRLEVSSKE